MKCTKISFQLYWFLHYFFDISNFYIEIRSLFRLSLKGVKKTCENSTGIFVFLSRFVIRDTGECAYLLFPEMACKNILMYALAKSRPLTLVSRVCNFKNWVILYDPLPGTRTLTQDDQSIMRASDGSVLFTKTKKLHVPSTVLFLLNSEMTYVKRYSVEKLLVKNKKEEYKQAHVISR